MALQRRIRDHIRGNVVAYLALFIALSGGSFAVAALSGQEKRVVKRIASKQITKRAPSLSVEHAGTAETADTATSADTAHDAERLDGKDPSAFLSDVVAATTGNMDTPSVAANSCVTGDMAVAGIQPGDHVIVTTPLDLSQALSVTSLIPNANNEARVRLCNHTNTAVDEPIRTFNVIAIRP